MQFRLLSGVFIDTALKRVRKQIDNVAEIRGYIKASCKLGMSVESIHDEICVVYGDKQMPFSTVLCLWLGPTWFNYRFPFTLAYSRISHEYSSLFIIVINLIFMFSL